MTQEQFADALGLSRNTINRYERDLHQRMALFVEVAPENWIIDTLETSQFSSQL